MGVGPGQVYTAAYVAPQGLYGGGGSVEWVARKESGLRQNGTTWARPGISESLDSEFCVRIRVLGVIIGCW